MNQICQLKYLIIEERVGLPSILLVKMMIFSIHQPLSFERGNEVSETNWLLRQNRAKQNSAQSPAGTWARPKTFWLFDVPQCIKFLIQPETFSKVPKKVASLVCQHCENCTEEEKENLSCVNFILFSSFVLFLLLPLLFLSVLQDSLPSNL